MLKKSGGNSYLLSDNYFKCCRFGLQTFDKGFLL